jgi:hypothetical protein
LVFRNGAGVAPRSRLFAPVNRLVQTAVLFDPSQQGGFQLDAPPAPWIGLGFIQGFTRKAASKSTVIASGIPATAMTQVRESLDARVTLQFLNWTKLTMALATGSQHMNVLAAESEAASAAVGAQAAPAAAIQSGSTATMIALTTADAATFAAGQIVAVDIDYTGQTGFVGSPVAGAYVRRAPGDVDYIRRVTFNVAVVASAGSTGLVLAEALPGGVPTVGAKVQAVSGFVDREGGSFYQEWSALFVMEGALGERIFFHYPRLQSMKSAGEVSMPLGGNGKGKLERIALDAEFLAFPVTDPLDGERVVCYRSFVPAKNALV